MRKFSFQDQQVHKIAKKKPSGMFFSIFVVKYFFNKRTVALSFRYLVKYNWNSTRKTKQKFPGLYPTGYYPLKSWKHEKLPFWGYFGGLGTNVQFNGFLWFHEFLKVSASIFWLKTVLTLNWVFSFIFNTFQGISSEKTFYVQITIVPGDIDAKKTRKAFHKLHINFFLNT